MFGLDIWFVSIKAPRFVHTHFACSGAAKIAELGLGTAYVFLARVAIIRSDYGAHFFSELKYFVILIEIHR